MGEAYDRTGAFLGSAEAGTKREVLEKFERAHGDKIDEVRIRTARDNPNDGNKKIEELSRSGQEREAPAPMPKPAVGRVVHYVAYGTPGGEFPAGVCRAAIITELSDVVQDPALEAIGVSVFNPKGMFFNQHIRHDEGKKPGTWHWPERVI